MQNSYINSKEYYLAVFKSRNVAVQLHYLLEKKGYRKFQLISTPCKIKHGCSYSLKFSRISDIEYLKKETSDFSNQIDGIYHVTRNSSTKEYKRVSNIVL